MKEICIKHPIQWIAFLVFVSSNCYADMSSTSYSIKWDAFTSGGGVSNSSNYLMSSSIGSTAIGESSSTNYQLVSGFLAPPDSDLDAVKDFLDNCIKHPNTDQRDTNQDGYGNRCDPDFNNDGAVNFADLAYLKSVFLTSDPDADLNGDGAVNFGDLAILKSMFLQSPGPSATNP